MEKPLSLGTNLTLVLRAIVRSSEIFEVGVDTSIKLYWDYSLKQWGINSDCPCRYTIRCFVATKKCTGLVISGTHNYLYSEFHGNLTISLYASIISISGLGCNFVIYTAATDDRLSFN